MRYATYYKSRLSGEEKKVYDAVCKGIANFETNITAPSIEKKRIRIVVFSVIYDNPEFFHVNFRHYSYIHTSERTEVILSYKMSREEYEETLDKARQKVKSICRGILSVSNRNRALEAHDWLVENVVYRDVEYFFDSQYTMPGALLYGECVCEGYSMAYKYILDYLKIHCTIVCGDAFSPRDGSRGPHAWNLLVVDGKAYHTDVTFDHLFAGKYCSRAYFLLSTKDILYDHVVDSLVPVPICPENGGYLKCVKKTSELINFLDTESKRNVSHSEVRLSAAFKSDQLMDMIKAWFNSHPEVSLPRNPQYWFGDYNKTLFIIWQYKYKNTSFQVQ